jgi:hypothetical protein
MPPPTPATFLLTRLTWISEYDINDERRTFNDGLEDDESEDSDASICYEELTDPDVGLGGVEVPLEDEESLSGHSDDSADENYVHTSEEDVEESETSGDDEQWANPVTFMEPVTLETYPLNVVPRPQGEYQEEESPKWFIFKVAIVRIALDI